VTTRLITAGELLQFPTGVDWDDLAEDAGATDPLQAIEQGFLIDSCSSWAGIYCNQPLGLHATTQTENARVERVSMFGSKTKVDDTGDLHFWANTLPVLSLVSAQWSYLAGALAWSPMTLGVTEPNQSGGMWALWGDYPNQRHLEFFDQDYSALRHQPSIVQVTYQSGWASAVLSGGPYAAGSNVTLTVDATDGMTATAGLVGNRLFIADGGLSEFVTVSAVVDETHVTVAALANAHTPETNNVIGIGCVPEPIKQAVILACAALAKVKGVNAYQMKTEGVSEVARSGGQEELITLAEYYLNPFKVEF
jgi:hypothetical protein